jgi:hypothetical protein
MKNKDGSKAYEFDLTASREGIVSFRCTYLIFLGFWATDPIQVTVSWVLGSIPTAPTNLFCSESLTREL